MKYSFVIPVHNEEKNLTPLTEEIDRVRKELQAPSEIIFVNDGSTDSGGAVLDSLAQKDGSIHVYSFKSNAGQSAALAEGIRQARGEVIITMDADLQNNPADIPKLLRYYPEYDVVIGRRTRRKDTLVKRVSSYIANAVRNLITEEHIADTGCSLKVFKAEYVKRVKFYNGLHRFLPTLCRLEGASVKEVPVSHRRRMFGDTHYGTKNRALVALIDAFAVRWMMKRRISCTCRPGGTTTGN
jgi:dolichol-phosphate mannosyltransferase